MWLLPHDADSTCSNGGCFGSVPQLRADRHFPHSPSTAMASSACSCTSPGLPATLGSSSATISDDGRIRRKPSSSRSRQRFAAKTCSGAVAAHHHARWCRRSDALGTTAFAHGNRHASFPPSRSADRQLRWWRLTKSLTPHPRFPRPAQHDARKRHPWHVWNDRCPTWSFSTWQRSAIGPDFSSDPASSGRRSPIPQPRRSDGN